MSINQERKLGDRRRSDTVVVLTINDVNQGLDKPKVGFWIESLILERILLTLPYSELKEKS